MDKIEIRALIEALVIYTEYNGGRPCYEHYPEEAENAQAEINYKVDQIKTILLEIIKEK